MQKQKVDKLKKPPKIIEELKEKIWLSQIFSDTNSDEIDFPDFEFRQGLYIHENVFKNLINFKSFVAQNFRVRISKYFNSFSIEFNTACLEIFNNQEEYFLNGNYPKETSWHYSGSRMSNYKYFEENRLTEIILTKQAENNVGILLSSSTIEKQPKTNIEFSLNLTGRFKTSNKKIELSIDDYSNLSEEELANTKKWKNIEVSKKSQLARNKMLKWINGLFECSIEMPNKKLRSIFLNEKQKSEIEIALHNSSSNKLNLNGEFKMFSDYTAILKSIDKLEALKH